MTGFAQAASGGRNPEEEIGVITMRIMAAGAFDLVGVGASIENQSRCFDSRDRFQFSGTLFEFNRYRVIVEQTRSKIGA